MLLGHADRWSRHLLIVCGAGSAALHLAVYLTQQSIHRGPKDGRGWHFVAPLAGYELATCGLFVLYMLVMRMVTHNRMTAGERRAVITIPVLFHLALLPVLPSLSMDVYSYLARGYVWAGLGLNPYVVGARAVADTPFGHEIAAYGWLPVHRMSPYGPVLEYLNYITVRVTHNPRLQVVLLKAVAVAAVFAAAVLIWEVLGRLRPREQMLGTTAFLWNPLIIWELSGEGHNDATMIVATMLALALILRHRYAGGVLAITVAALTKYLPLIIVPLCAAYLWRTGRARQRLVRRTLLGGIAAAALVVGLFLPVWAGVDTFQGVRVNGALGSSGSTPTMALEILERVAPQVAWGAVLPVATVLGLLGAVVWQARRVTNEPSLLNASAIVWLLFLLLFCPTYWPWYAAVCVSLAVLAPDHRLFTLAVVLSFSARVAAPLAMIYVHNGISRPLFLGTVWIIGLGLPLVALTVLHGVLVAPESNMSAGGRP